MQWSGWLNPVRGRIQDRGEEKRLIFSPLKASLARAQAQAVTFKQNRAPGDKILVSVGRSLCDEWKLRNRRSWDILGRQIMVARFPISYPCHLYGMRGIDQESNWTCRVESHFTRYIKLSYQSWVRWRWGWTSIGPWECSNSFFINVRQNPKLGRTMMAKDRPIFKKTTVCRQPGSAIWYILPRGTGWLGKNDSPELLIYCLQFYTSRSIGGYWEPSQ